jgi:glycosyltransferase domain-containing protein
MAPRLTIVLPLRGRHLFTFRFLWHANKCRLPYHFLIADGKVNEAVACRLENSRKDFPELDIEYVRYPDDINYSRFFTKMADVMQRVRTPYAMLADNDDFLGLDGIEGSLDFLDQNPNYICARGHALNFSVRTPSFAYGRICGKFNRFYMHKEDKTVTASTVTERLRQGGLCHAVYNAVYRTAAPIRIWREIAEMDLTDLMLYEDFFALRTLTLGKIHTHRDTISYYSQAATSITHEPLRDWASHLLRSRFTSDVHALIKRIACAAAETDHVDVGSIAENVRTTLEHYYGNFLSTNYGLASQIKRRIRARWPRLVNVVQNRPRFSVKRERAAVFSRLRSAGASRQRIDVIRGEIANIQSALSSHAFADFASPFLSIAQGDSSREWV